MELGRPCWVIKLLNRFLEIVPCWRPPACTTPACVRQKFAPIELHDVDFATPRPAACRSQSPKRRPQSRTRIDSCAHLKATVSPLMQTLGQQTGRGVCRIRSAFADYAGR